MPSPSCCLGLLFKGIGLHSRGSTVTRVLVSVLGQTGKEHQQFCHSGLCLVSEGVTFSSSAQVLQGQNSSRDSICHDSSLGFICLLSTWPQIILFSGSDGCCHLWLLLLFCAMFCVGTTTSHTDKEGGSGTLSSWKGLPYKWPPALQGFLTQVAFQHNLVDFEAFLEDKVLPDGSM